MKGGEKEMSDIDTKTPQEDDFKTLANEIRKLKKDNEMIWKYIENEAQYKQMQVDDLKPKRPQKIQIFSAACTTLAIIMSIIVLTLKLL